MNLNLTVRYRNLLIVLAREHQKVSGIIAEYRELAWESDARTRNGLLTKAKALERQARSMQFIITRNRAAMRHFFGTEKLELVAQEAIE